MLLSQTNDEHGVVFELRRHVPEQFDGAHEALETASQQKSESVGQDAAVQYVVPDFNVKLLVVQLLAVQAGLRMQHSVELIAHSRFAHADVFVLRRHVPVQSEPAHVACGVQQVDEFAVHVPPQ